MARTISLGIQNFGRIREGNHFYVDKTEFIKKWWYNRDDVTLIARPKRFGKTLSLSMMEHFFSTKYKGRGYLFEGLKIWEDEEFREMQGTYPVISLSFAGANRKGYYRTIRVICKHISDVFSDHDYMLDGAKLTDDMKDMYRRTKEKLDDILYGADNSVTDASLEVVEFSLRILSQLLTRYHGTKVLIFLDEYDTPMKDAYVNGYWNEMAAFIGSLLNNTFKTNPYSKRAILTGRTGISKDSIFSGLNNMVVVTAQTEMYEKDFGFTEEEVYQAMDEMGLEDKKLVRMWYGGFVFGQVSDMYNPWSIANYLRFRTTGVYWVRTSSIGIVGTMISASNKKIKMDFETLIQGGVIETTLEEQIVFRQLDEDDGAIWSYLVGSGYLKILTKDSDTSHLPKYTLAVTNLETRIMFENMTKEWFNRSESDYEDFISAMMNDNLEEMNIYMNRIADESYEIFDSGKKSAEDEPEIFYHGFVLGLLVKLSDKYDIRSNRNSGYGRYDIYLLPKKGKMGIDPALPGIIIEFRVKNDTKESNLEVTADAALKQIDEKKYVKKLIDHGVNENMIRKYGFAFNNKEILIRD